LSPLDYIYSDTINALMALNRITLDVSGRLSLLGPQPEVLQILKRAGIHNILRIFDNETELIRTSEEIILQTSSFHLGELKNLAQQEPQSEFDQLRSEIGSAFGGTPSDMHEDPLPPPPKTKNLSSYMPTQPPVAGPIASSIEQEFDDAFSQFESEESGMDYSAATPNQYNNPQTANYIPPPPPTRTVFNPAAAQFQNRQYTPQPPVSPVPPPRPVVPQSPVFESPQMPSGSQPTDFSGVRNDRFQPPVSSRAPQPAADKEFEDEIAGKGRTSKIKVQDDSFDESDDEFFEEGKKKSPVPMLVLILVLLAIGGVGVYFAYNMLSSKPEVQTPVSTTPQPQPPAPPASVDTTSKVSETQVKEEVKDEPEQKVVEKKTEPKARETARVSQPVPKARPQQPVTPRRSSFPSTPAESENKVVITSIPSGAKVTINGDYVGITPFTWDKPIFGPLSVVVSKDGYEDESKVFEFTGGSTRESFTLRKAAIAPPPPVTYSEPEPEPEPVAPKYTPPPAPAPTPIPGPVEKPAPMPTPVSSVISGGEASIFIASIPPVADVYLDGKLIGKTNVSEIKLPAGTHNLKFVKGVKEITKAITVQPGKNPSQMVRLQ
jgi:hypothetical protein